MTAERAEGGLGTETRASPPLPARRWSLGRLRGRLSLVLPLLVAAVALPVCLAGVLLARSLYEKQEEAAGENAAALASGVMESVELVLMERLAFLRAVGEAPAVQEGDTPAMTAYFRAVAEAGRPISFIDERGVLRASSDLAASAAAVDLSHVPHVREVLATGEAVIADAREGAADGRPIVVLAQPVYRNGELLGMVTMSMRLDEAKGLYATLLDVDADIRVLDRSGQVLFANGPVPGLAAAPGSTLLEDIRAAGQGYRFGALGFEDDRREVIGFARGPQSGWLALVEQDEASVLGDARRAMLFESWGLALAAVAGVSAAAFAGRRLERHAEAERTARERFIDFANSLPVIAFIASNTGLRFINRFALEYLGKREEELLGRGMEPYIHPDDLPGAEEASRAAIANRSSFVAEYRVRTADGSYRWQVVRARPLERDGELEWFGTITDIHDRKEAALAAGMLAAVVDSTSDAVVSVDLEGRIQSWNRGAEELLGWSAKEMIGRPLASIIPPAERATMEAINPRLFAGEKVTLDTIRLRKDGSLVPVSLSASAILDEAGRVVATNGILRDITSRVAHQRELERTIKAKDDFLGMVSHELRTPLTQVLGNAELLVRRGEGLPPEVREESIAEIHAQARRLQRVVNNMLSISRLERGVATETQPELLQRLIPACVQDFHLRFPGVKLVLEIGDDLPPVEADRTAVEQVLWNLLSNAGKYGPPQGPITVRCEAGTNEVRVLVIDEGPGVADHELQAVFEPYFRSGANPAHTSGIGLGLPVCQRLIQAQGGRMFATRDEFGRMVFGFSLLLADEAEG